MDIVNSNSVPSPSPGRPPSSPNPRPRVKPKLKAKPKPASTTTTPPKTSSPLILAPSFVCRPSSPDATNKVQVVIASSSASPARLRKDSGVSVGGNRGSVKAKARRLDEVDTEQAVGA
ncbi:hypothetical protein C0992_000608 [Termitomyces sp. T32_za158]|nr:hypothetical protein C0992_000608 [Termitomyces sp. T32_za158]